MVSSTLGVPEPDGGDSPVASPAGMSSPELDMLPDTGPASVIVSDESVLLCSTRSTFDAVTAAYTPRVDERRGIALERRAALRAAVLTAVALGVAVVILALAMGGPAYFLQLGAESPGLAKAQEVLGADVVTPLPDGHDGDRFWQLARDPLLRNDQSLERYLDRPIYRAQRIGYPALVAPWRLFGEGALLWGMVITNIVAIGVGSYLVGLWSAAHGGPGRLAYAFAFNPLALYSLLFDLGDAVALAALMAAVHLFQRRRAGPMVIAACLGALAKEPTLLALGAVALLARERPIKDRCLLVVPAAIAAGAWRLYILTRPDLSGGAGVREFTRVPLSGFVDSWRFAWWPEAEWSQAIPSLGLLAVAVACVVLWARAPRRVELAAALPFALMAPFLAPIVVSVSTNTVRALGPALLFLSIHVVLRRYERSALPTSPRV